MPIPVRLIVFGAVGVALVAVPLAVLKQERRTRPQAADAAERAVDIQARAASAPPAAPADPNRMGLTYGWRGVQGDGRFNAACNGQPPSELAGRHAGECDRRTGDTSCRAALPLLCLREAPPGALELASTGAVPGFALASLDDADARCAAELGAGWRMARYRDGQGLGVLGRAAENQALATHQRAWVADESAQGNCWNALPR
jgi:hypothetical protein